MDEVLASSARTARAVFDAAACSIALLDDASGELVFRVAGGAGADAIMGRHISTSTGLAGWAVTSGQAIAVSDLRADPRFARDLAEETGYVPTTILAAPLESDDDALGVIQVAKHPGLAPFQIKTVLHAVADNAGGGARHAGDLTNA